MKSRVAVALMLGALTVGAGALTSRPQDLVGKAPAFTATTPDGKKVDLAGLHKKGPVFLFFIKKDCPVTSGAMDFYKDIYKAYGKKATIVGVLNGNAAEYRAYNKDHQLPFTTILDPEAKIVNSYRVEHSPWITTVKADGTVGATWKGYSQSFLQQMNKAVAKAAGQPVATVDFSRAPKETRFG